MRDIKKLDYLELFGNIADIIGTDEIDLVVLNTAPISLAGRILQRRKVLVDKKPFLRHRYESLVLREFFDFTVKERGILREFCTTLIFGQFWSLRGASEPLAASKAWRDAAISWLINVL